MKRIRHVSSLLLACSLMVLPMLGGCVIHGRAAVVVDAEPPPPRYVEVELRPGHLWVDGFWVYRGSRWVWTEGHYVRHRPGHVYVQGRWAHHGGRWHWVEGRWDRGRARNPDVRDHRRGERPAVRDHRDDRGPAVRDHRDGRPAKKKPKKDGDVERRDHR